MSVQDSLTLAPGLHAPSQARAWLAARLGAVPRANADDALLIVSELVTNAVRHGDPDIVLQVAVTAEKVRLEVSDGNDALPVLPAAEPAVDRPTGRGLLIVAATAADWGVIRTDGPGKRIWAEVRIDPGEAQR